MPLERQWERQQTSLRRLSPRERTILLVVFAVLAIGGVATAIAAVGNDKIAPDQKGCVAIAIPSTMGGGMQRACGNAARRFCATDEAGRSPAVSRQLDAACRRAGIG